MPEEPLRLYVNRRLMLPDRSPIPLLYPFFGIPAKAAAPYTSNAHRLHGFSPRYFRMVEDARMTDFVVVPQEYRTLAANYPETLQQIYDEARAARKPLLIDDTGDVHGPPTPPDSVVLRVDDYRFAPHERGIVIPLAVEDFVETYCEGKFVPREKAGELSVGFVGWAKLTLQQHTRNFVKEIPLRLRALSDSRYHAMEKGVIWRRRALAALERTTGIRTNVLVRETFGGRTDTLPGDPKKIRQEFVDNLRESDYSLCVRGDANISYRFYETLSMGRIPLFLDTECVLPLEDKIDYRSFCVFVDWRDVDSIGERLKAFHASLSEGQFKAMQEKAREAFVQYLRLDSFSPYLAEYLMHKASEHSGHPGV